MVALAHTEPCSSLSSFNCSRSAIGLLMPQLVISSADRAIRISFMIEPIGTLYKRSAKIHSFLFDSINECCNIHTWSAIKRADK